MKKWLTNLIISFFSGGFITASIAYMGTFMSPILASIWWSFPISLIPSMYYMKQEGKTNKEISYFCFTTTFALIILFLTTLSLSHFFLHEKKSFWMPLVKSFGVFTVISLIYYLIIHFFNLQSFWK